MSSLALDGSEASAEGQPPLALRFADLGLLALALPVFVVADLPMLGYAAAAVAWLAQHVLFAFAQKRAVEALRRGERRTAVGSIAVATLGRLWLVTGTVLAVGLIADREDGLAAAVLSAALVTVHLGTVALCRLLYPESRELR